MSKSYKIDIIVSDAGGVYTADNIEEANEIAQALCDDIYTRLNGHCGIEVRSIEEVITQNCYLIRKEF